MLNQEITIQNKLGLHARAASVFVKTAGGFGADITVSTPEKSANGKSIMSMMMLQATLGTQIKIVVDGEDEEDALKAIIQLINDKFGESE